MSVVRHVFFGSQLAQIYIFVVLGEPAEELCFLRVVVALIAWLFLYGGLFFKAYRSFEVRCHVWFFNAQTHHFPCGHTRCRLAFFVERLNLTFGLKFFSDASDVNFGNLAGNTNVVGRRNGDLQF